VWGTFCYSHSFKSQERKEGNLEKGKRLLANTPFENSQERKEETRHHRMPLPRGEEGKEFREKKKSNNIGSRSSQSRTSSRRKGKEESFRDLEVHEKKEKENAQKGDAQYFAQRKKGE